MYRHNKKWQVVVLVSFPGGRLPLPTKFSLSNNFFNTEKIHLTETFVDGGRFGVHNLRLDGVLNEERN